MFLKQTEQNIMMERILIEYQMTYNLLLQRKDPGLAAVLSFFLPGLGLIYCGLIALGFLSFIFISACIVLIIALPIKMLWLTVILAVLATPAWIFIIYKSYSSAMSVNKRLIADIERYRSNPEHVRQLLE